jgi:predicted acyltransferase
MTLRSTVEPEVSLPVLDGPRPDPIAALPVADASPGSPAEAVPQKRLASVDAFRGFTIFGMLLVNNVTLGKAAPDQLVHADWGQGVRFADAIFPWFLLIVGLSIPLAAASHRRKGLGSGAWVRKVLTRTALLVLLGCAVDSSIKGYPLFCLGVLQLIGLSYLVAALFANLSQYGRLGVAALLFAANWLILTCYPVPEFGPGSFAKTQNFVTWLNETYLKTYSLEGLFSVVSTSGLVILGTIFGDALRREEGMSYTEIGYLFVSGLILTGLGSLWSQSLPYSKPMWTSSYLLFTGGTGLMVLAFLRLTLDMSPYRLWALPLLIFGANAITVYVVPILVKMLVLQHYVVTGPDGTEFSAQKALYQYALHAGGDPISGGWIYTVAYIGFWWVVLAVLYRFKLFLRV